MAAEKNQSHIKHGLAQTLKEPQKSKDVHIVVPFAYLLSSYSKFESGRERGGSGLLVMHTKIRLWITALQYPESYTKKLSGKQNIQICCTTK